MLVHTNMHVFPSPPASNPKHFPHEYIDLLKHFPFRSQISGPGIRKPDPVLIPILPLLLASYEFEECPSPLGLSFLICQGRGLD